MKAIKTLVKTSIVATGFISLIAMAESYYDSKFYNEKFIDSVAEVEIDMSAAAPAKRVVASDTPDLPTVQILEMTEANLINGKWQITKILDDKGTVKYDSENNRGTDSGIASFELIEESVVRINNDLEMTYYISLLTREGTIALFKEYGEGYEIVQAVRVEEDSLVENKLSETQSKKSVSKYHIDEDLSLVSALDSKKKGLILRGDVLEGSARLKNGELILEGVRLHVGGEDQTESFSMSVTIRNHGTFNNDEGIGGIVTNVSSQEMKVRFSMGSLAGVVLSFAIESKKLEIEEKFGVLSKQIIPSENREREVQVQDQERDDEDDSRYYEEVSGDRENQLDSIDAEEFSRMRMENADIDADELESETDVDFSEASFEF